MREFRNEFYKVCGLVLLGLLAWAVYLNALSGRYYYYPSSPCGAHVDRWTNTLYYYQNGKCWYVNVDRDKAKPEK